MANKEKKELNLAQRQAVEHLSGPLLIIAGAGTGKTTVITEKIKYLVANKLARPEEVLALTFTEKAALEMEERIDVALPLGYTDTWIMTFHAFCDRVLKDEATQIGLDPGFNLMTQSESVQFLLKHLFDLRLDYFRPLGNPNKFVVGLLTHFSRLKDEDVTPKQYFDWAKQLALKNQKTEIKKEEKAEQEKYLELAAAYQEYERLKQKEGWFDFADLIAHTLKLFRKRPNVLAYYRKKFKYFLVDEFQDTNIAQYQLIKLLAPPLTKPQLSVVADDSQSIYRFRGAAVSNVLRFMSDYPLAKSVVLIENYRSTQTILNSAYQLIQHNNPDTLEVKLGIDKNLVSVNGLGCPVSFVYTKKVEEEAEEVARIIKEEKEKRPSLSWSDFAILVRANNHAIPFMKALLQKSIPYQFLGPGQLFRQEEIKNLIAYLLLLTDPHHDQACYRILGRSPLSLSGRDLVELTSWARKVNLSLFGAIELVLGQSKTSKVEGGLPSISLSEEARQKLTQMTKMINRHLELSKEKSAGQVLYYYLEESGLLKELVKVKSPREERRVENIAYFFDRLFRYEISHEDASVGAVVDWIKVALELGESPSVDNDDWLQENKVNLLTVHSAKGLEFEIVFLVNLVAGRFPVYGRREQIPIPDELIKEILPQGNYHDQEERRLFYVGMTRAKNKLFLTASKLYGEEKRSRKISPFVYQALTKVEINVQPEEKTGQLSLLRFKPIENKEEDVSSPKKINHLSFSQITAFEHCPAQYHYQYRQKIPATPNGAQSFGTAIHRTLSQFYQQVKNSNPSLKDLFSCYQKNWLSFGYSSRFQEEKFFNEGKKMLARFYREDFKQKKKPLFLERKFNFFLTEKVKITGIFDRVDKENNAWEIIDYKTSQAIDQKQADKSLQMNLYLLAAADPGILGANPDYLTGTFYFLKEGQRISVKKTALELDKAKKALIKTVEVINQSDFAPKAGFWCDFCPFKIVCDAWE